MTLQPRTYDCPARAVHLRRAAGMLGLLLTVLLWSGGSHGVRAGEQPPELRGRPGAGRLAAPVTPPPAPLVRADGAWTPHGPGPVTALAPHPTDADILYAGTAHAGVWKSLDAGAAQPTWARQTTAQQGLAIRALAFDPDDDQVLIAGVAAYEGLLQGVEARPGVLYTNDAGASWQRFDVPGGGLDIAAVAARGQLLLAAADGPGDGEGGLWRSTDGGTTWVRIDSVPDGDGNTDNGLPTGPITDLVGDPDPTRRDWFYASVLGHSVYVTVNGGQTWFDYARANAQPQTAIQAPGANNARMAVAGNGRLYLGVLDDGLLTWVGYADVDAGWLPMEMPGTDQPDAGLLVDRRTGRAGRRYFSIATDPRPVGDPRLVYVGGDGQPAGSPAGVTPGSGRLFRGDTTTILLRLFHPVASPQWTTLTHDGTAGDTAPAGASRVLAFDADGNLLEGNDAGVFRRTAPVDATGDWFSAVGDLRASEVHDVAFDRNDNTAVAGVLDVGVASRPRNNSADWARDVLGADRDDVAVGDTAAASIRYRSTTLLQQAAAAQAQTYTPLALNAADPARLVLGAANGVFETTDGGATFASISAANVKANGAEGHVMAYGAANDADALYVGAGSDLYVRTGAGGDLQRAATYPGTATVRGVVLDPDDGQTAYACDDANVYKTADGGATWQTITGNLLTLANACRVLGYVRAADGMDAIVAGTEAGVFFARIATPTTWAALGTNPPAAPVQDMDYDAAGDVLVVGTLGGGAWSYAPVTDAMPDDTEDPVVTCPNAVTVEATGPNGAIVTYPPATVTDNVDANLVATCTPASGTTFALGPTTVTCAATDTAGNTGTCTFTVTVRDTTAPTLTCPPTKRVVANAPTIVNYDPATATDLVDAAPTITYTQDSGSLFPLGTTTITVTARDDAGNESTCMFDVIVGPDPIDTVPPVVTCPADITVEATGPGGAVVDYPPATVTDNVDTNLVATCTPVSGSVFPLGPTTVTCSATDMAGNTGTCTFIVTVVDTTPPDITCPAAIVAEATGPGGAAVTFAAATATDLVDGTLVATCDRASGSVFPRGTTTVTCTATDAAGNAGTCTFTVTVRDTTAPVLTCPADVTVALGAGQTETVVTWPPASATDLVDGPVAVDCDPDSGSTFAVGSHTITCAAVDAAGNLGTCTFEVRVIPPGDLCDPAYVCEGPLHEATVETEIFVGDTDEIDLAVVFLGGFLYHAPLVDRVDLDYVGAFPGATTGLQDVLTVVDVTVTDFVAKVTLRVVADASVFPADAFGDAVKRIDVTVNGRRNVGIARFVGEEIRPGAWFSWNPRCGERPACGAPIVLPAGCPARFEPRFAASDNESVEQWRQCP